MVSRIVVRGSALACLALLLGACGKPVTITVTADVAMLWDAPRQGATAVGEELPGKPLEARRGGLLGAKGFFELRRDGRTVYLSERDAAPVPLAGAAMVVAAEDVKTAQDRKLERDPKTLRFGAVVQVFETEPGDATTVVVLRDGLRAGYATRKGLVHMSGASATLGAAVLEAARAGDAARTLERADGMAASGIGLDPKLQALVAALREAEKGPPRPGPASFLRTAGPPEAGSRAYVASLSLPAYAGPDLSGAPVGVLEIDRIVEVLELAERAAKVRPGGLELANRDEPARWAAEDAAPEEVYVDARGLQAGRQTAADLSALAGEAKKVEERMELLARAAVVPDAPPDGFQRLFDAAMDANEPAWAAWAVQRWSFVDLVIWASFPDAARARTLAKALGPLPRALDPAVAVAAAPIDPAHREGLARGDHLVAAGACVLGETVTDGASSLLETFHPGVVVRRARIPLGGEAVRLRCPGFGLVRIGDCGTREEWKLESDESVAVGKRTLRGLQFTSAPSPCSYLHEWEVVTTLLAVDPDGTVIEATQLRPPLVESYVGWDVFRALAASVTASGKGLRVAVDRLDGRCDTVQPWEIYRATVKLQLDAAGHIATEKPSERRIQRGRCEPPESGEGD